MATTISPLDIMHSNRPVINGKNQNLKVPCGSN